MMILLTLIFLIVMQLKELGSCEEDMERLNSEGDKEACPSGQGV